MNLSDMLKRKKNNKMEETNKLDEQELGEHAQNNTSPEEESYLDTENEEENDSVESQDTLSEEDKLKAEVSEWQNKHLRLYAEFDNFKRRTSKERLELLSMAGKDIIVDLLPVLDDFERAQKSMDAATDVEAVKEGVRLINQKLKNILSQKGLKEMDSIGNEFNADLHEGVTNIPAPTEDLKGKVVDEVERGYFLNDKVIRFAKVIVGS